MRGGCTGGVVTYICRLVPYSYRTYLTYNIVPFLLSTRYTHTQQKFKISTNIRCGYIAMSLYPCERSTYPCVEF